MDLGAAEARAPPRLRHGDRLAALDLGTNNCRLLIAEWGEEGLVVVDSFSRIVRLGEGLSKTNRLSETAMARTLAALKICSRIIQRHHVVMERCVATEACRRSENGGDFVRRVRRVTGLDLQILPQDEEARLAMLGCLPLIDPDVDHLFVVDIGGGSTEIMWLDRLEPRGLGEPGKAISLPLGVVTLSESFGGELDMKLYADMVGFVLERLRTKGRDRELPGLVPGQGVQMLGTSGTVTTLAAVHLGLRRYDRRKVDGLSLPFTAIQAVSAQLRALDNAERAAHPCIGNGRADLVVAGCAILDAVHELWPVEHLRVADRGVREGILASLTGSTLREMLRPAALPA